MAGIWEKALREGPIEGLIGRCWDGFGVPLAAAAMWCDAMALQIVGA